MTKDIFTNLSAFLINQKTIDLDHEGIKKSFDAIMSKIKSSPEKKVDLIGEPFTDGYKYNEDGLSIIGLAAIHATPYQFFKIFKLVDKTYIKAYVMGRTPNLSRVVLGDNVKENLIVSRIDTSLAKLIIDQDRVDIINSVLNYYDKNPGKDSSLEFRILYRKILLEFNCVDYSLAFKTSRLALMEAVLQLPIKLDKDIYKRCRVEICNFVKITRDTMEIRSHRFDSLPEMPFSGGGEGAAADSTLVENLRGQETSAYLGSL